MKIYKHRYLWSDDIMLRFVLFAAEIQISHDFPPAVIIRSTWVDVLNGKVMSCSICLN